MNWFPNYTGMIAITGRFLWRLRKITTVMIAAMYADALVHVCMLHIMQAST